MCFIPVYLSEADGSICKTHLCRPFAFSPTARTVCAAQTGDFANRTANRKRLNISDLSDNFKFHARIFRSMAVVTYIALGLLQQR